MTSEQGLRYNALSRRADLLIYDATGKPLLLAECKAPQVAISTDTLSQIAAYQKSLQAKILVLTNGMELKCFSLHDEQQQWQSCSAIPPYRQG